MIVTVVVTSLGAIAGWELSKWAWRLRRQDADAESKP